jgi:hypothetical protein
LGERPAQVRSAIRTAQRKPAAPEASSPSSSATAGGQQNAPRPGVAEAASANRGLQLR